MANLFQVNPEDLRRDALNLDEARQLDMAVMSKMRALVVELNSIWQGAAQAEYVAKFESMQPVFNAFYDLLKQFADVEKAAADEAERVDQELLSQINGI